MNGIIVSLIVLFMHLERIWCVIVRPNLINIELNDDDRSVRMLKLKLADEIKKAPKYQIIKDRDGTILWDNEEVIDGVVTLSIDCDITSVKLKHLDDEVIDIIGFADEDDWTIEFLMRKISGLYQEPFMLIHNDHKFIDFFDEELNWRVVNPQTRIHFYEFLDFTVDVKNIDAEMGHLYYRGKWPVVYVVSSPTVGDDYKKSIARNIGKEKGYNLIAFYTLSDDTEANGIHRVDDWRFIFNYLYMMDVAANWYFIVIPKNIPDDTKLQKFLEIQYTKIYSPED